MLARAAIGERRRRLGGRELARDPPDVGRGQAGFTGREFRRVGLQVRDQPRRGDIRPVADEIGVIQPLVHDHMRHRQRDRRVGARIGREPFMGIAGRVRQPDVEGDDLGPVADHAVDQALGVRVHEIGGLEDVRAEVEDVFGVGPVAGFDVRSPGRFQPHLLRGLADVGVVQDRVRAERVGKAIGRAAGAVAAILEHDLVQDAGVALGPGAVDHLAQLFGQDAGRLVVAEALPLALAARAGAQERGHDPVGIIDMEVAGIALRAQLAAGVGVLEVALELDDPAVLDHGDPAILDVAGHAGIGRGLPFFARDRGKVRAAKRLLHRHQPVTRQCGANSGGRRAELEKTAAVGGEFVVDTHRVAPCQRRAAGSCQ